MKSRLFGLGMAAATLPAVLIPLLLPPAAHAEDSLSPGWVKDGQYFAQRQKPDGTWEDVKDKDEKGGTTTFNKDNMQQRQHGGQVPSHTFGWGCP